MSDDVLRRLAREGTRSGSTSPEWLLQAVRAGRLSSQALRVKALLGDPAATEVLAPEGQGLPPLAEAPGRFASEGPSAVGLVLLGCLECVADGGLPDLFLAPYLSVGREALWRFVANGGRATPWLSPFRGEGANLGGSQRASAIEAAWHLLEVVRRHCEAPPTASPERSADTLARALILAARSLRRRGSAERLDCRDPLGMIVETGAWATEAAWGLRPGDPRTQARAALEELASASVKGARTSLREVRPLLEHRPEALGESSQRDSLRDDSWMVVASAVDQALELTRNGRRPKSRARHRWRPAWVTRWHELADRAANSSCAPLRTLRQALADVGGAWALRLMTSPPPSRP